MILQLLTRWVLRRLQPSYWMLVLRMRSFDPALRARFQAAQWLAAEHYANHDDERFLNAVEAARHAGSARARQVCGEGVFLPDVLYANHLLAQGPQKAKEAIALYEEQIREQSRRHAAVIRYSNPEERRNAEVVALSLALLHCNLASALAADGREAAEIDRALDAALRHQPNLRYVRDTIGREYVRRKEWDRARAAYRDAWRLSPGGDAKTSYDNAIANLDVAQAAELETEGKLDEAIGLLQDALARAPKGWSGRIRLALARLYADQGRAGEALDAYRSSAAEYDDADDPSSASFVRSFLADYLIDQRREREALAACSDALQSLARIAEPGLEQRRLRRDVAARAGLLKLALGEPDAQQQLGEWRRLSLAISPWDPYSPIADLGAIARHPRLAGALRAYLDAALRNEVPDVAARVLVEGVRSLWQDDLWDEPGEKAPDVVGMLNVMTPIAIELESQALDRLRSDAILEAFKGVRASLESRYGALIPGVRLRDLDGADAGEYRILIHETRREQGRLHPESVAVVDADEAVIVGMKGEPVMNGLMQRWHWIGGDTADAAARAGLDVRTPLQMLMHHVEHTLAANLVELVAHQEVQNLLERHKLMKPGESQKIVTMEAARHMGPLTKVVRALVAERVPLTGFPALYERFSARRATGASAAEIVEDIRQMDAVRELLWGNDGRHALWLLGASFESELERHLAGRAGGAVLMARRERDALLDPIRDGLGGATRVALVVARQRHRALVRALVAPVFPHVPVLSRRELRAGSEAHVAGTLELGVGRPAIAESRA